jgi:hypothetical protein
VFRKPTAPSGPCHCTVYMHVHTSTRSLKLAFVPYNLQSLAMKRTRRTRAAVADAEAMALADDGEDAHATENPPTPASDKELQTPTRTRTIPKRVISVAARNAAEKAEAEKVEKIQVGKQEREKALSAAPRTTDDLWAAVIPLNIHQIFLRRSTLEEIRTRPKVDQVWTTAASPGAGAHTAAVTWCTLPQRVVGHLPPLTTVAATVGDQGTVCARVAGREGRRAPAGARGNTAHKR